MVPKSAWSHNSVHLNAELVGSQCLLVLTNKGECFVFCQDSQACVWTTFRLRSTTQGKRLSICTLDHWIQSLSSPCLSAHRR